MNGIVAQTIAMVSFGNEYLKQNRTETFYPENSTFEHCHRIDFREMQKSIFSKSKERIIANNPIEWFALLKKNGCKKLSLYYQTENESDYRTSAFVGGGGNWYIECIYKNYSDFWISNWNHNKEFKDKPWNVIYGKSVSKRASINRQYDLQTISQELNDILDQITEFAYRETTEHWGNLFEKSRESLVSINPVVDFYHTDLLYWSNYELKNQQLLMASSKALVFGGMGSWNDQWFENEEIENRFKELSKKLYEMIMKGIECSINTSEF